MDPGVGREEPGDVEVAHGRWGRRWDRVGLGCLGEQHAGGLSLAEEARVQPPSGLRTDDDLSRLGDGLHAGGLRRRRPGDDELTVAVAEQVEVEPAAVRADRDLQRDAPGGGPEASDPAHRPRHEKRRPAGTGRGVRVGEVQEDSVPTPLEEVGAVGGGDAEEFPEDRADDVTDLLGTDLAASCEAFGQRREA